MALDILNNKITKQVQGARELTKEGLFGTLTVFDLKRLDSYANNMVDYHLILDLLPALSQHYFLHRLGETSLSPVQQGILAGLGLQRKSVEELEKELSLPSSQILALFNKVIRKISQAYRAIQHQALEQEDQELTKKSKGEKRKRQEEENGNEDEDEEDDVKGDSKKRDLRNQEHWEPLETSLKADLTEAGNEVKKKLKEEQRKMLDSMNLQQYNVAGTDEDWEKVASEGKIPSSVSIANPNSSKLTTMKKRAQQAEASAKKDMEKEKAKREKKHKSKH